MKKTYPPYEVTYIAPAGTYVIFDIAFISDGNFGSTFVNLPGSLKDKLIKNEGQYNLGKIEDLAVERTVISSNFLNPADEEDTIKIKYSINDETVIHQNLKSEADDVTIYIIITYVVS
ncbi:hypothetical protein ACLI09_03395 [Flavobacterium sp. RHBU_24]|uniref:hypothetical protein n=1 Tax=Flavobacterium sp. RHBU_24 TaxID=3391185 RepID=UPI003984ED07